MADSKTPQSATLQITDIAEAGGQVVFLDNGALKSFPLSQITDLLKGSLTPDVLNQPDALNRIGQVQSFADLRKFKPRTDGTRVSLRGWNPGTCVGGGVFIGRLVTDKQRQQTDDGGQVAAGNGFYWEREIENVGQMNVTHFGAIPDGRTDAVPAMKAMLDWSLKKCRGVGIQFPAGTFFVSSLKFTDEVGYFRISGNPVNFGYFTNTVLVTDTNSNFMIDIAARRAELAYLNVVGVSTAQKPDKKGFFNNIVTGGQYFNMTCVRFEKLGGTCVKLIDTLDTKMTQWYASWCTGDVIVSTWSGRAAGAWDHSTAIEMSNFNVQRCYGGKVFDLQRCTQSFITNGWIEHCDDPGTLGNGQWTLNGLSIEDCKQPLRAPYGRLIEFQRNLQSGSSMDYSAKEGDEEWLSEWERGRIDVATHGMFIDGSFEPGTIMSRYKLNNPGAAPKWFRLGMWYTPSKGDSVEINMVGTGGMQPSEGKLSDIDDAKQGGGNTLIRVQLKNGRLGATLQPMGSSPVAKAKITKNGANRFYIYVQLKPDTRNIIPLITATGSTHFERGISYYFRPDVAEVTEADIGKLANTTDIEEQWSIGQQAGVGATNEGHLILKGKIEKDHLAVQVVINGKTEIRYLDLKTKP